MTKCSCPNCGGNSTLYIQATDMNHHVSDSTFDYYLCANCKLVFLYPVPENLGMYYETTYPPHRIPATATDLQSSAEQVQWRVDMVQSHVKSGKMLEIGSSYGAFATAAGQAGFNVDAIEMDKECCDFININIQNVTAIHTADVVEDISSLKDTYQVVALWHNLEHLTNPWAVLDKSIDHLDANGILVVSTPNPKSLQFKLFKKYWVHLDAPRHVMLVPSSCLTKFLADKGMELVSITTTDPDGLLLNRMSWGLSLVYALRVSKNNLARKILTRLFGWVMLPIERWLQLGTAYTAIYRKL